MIVGALEVSLRLEGCRSLKDKRRIVRSLLDRLRHDLHLSVAEVGDNDLWGNAEIGIACVSGSVVQVEAVLQQALAMVDGCADVTVQDQRREITRM